MKKTIIQHLADIEQSGQLAALCTIIESSGSTPRHTGSKMLVFEDGKIEGTIGGGELENRVIQEALQAIKEEKTKKLNYKMADPTQGDPGVCGGQVEIFVEPILPPKKIIVIGAGHVGKAVAHLAKWLGYMVIISDDRPEYCTPAFVPDADEYIICSLADLVKETHINPQTALILTTRNIQVDIEGLPSLITSTAGYIGVIGSKKRWATTTKKLIEKGIKPEALENIHSPMGLELKAETPEEIALSIMAEILLLKTKSSGKPMK